MTGSSGADDVTVQGCDVKANGRGGNDVVEHLVYEDCSVHKRVLLQGGSGNDRLTGFQAGPDRGREGQRPDDRRRPRRHPDRWRWPRCRGRVGWQARPLRGRGRATLRGVIRTQSSDGTSSSGPVAAQQQRERRAFAPDGPVVEDPQQPREARPARRGPAAPSRPTAGRSARSRTVTGSPRARPGCRRTSPGSRTSRPARRGSPPRSRAPSRRRSRRSSRRARRCAATSATSYAACQR